MGRWAWLGIAAIAVVMVGAVLRIEPLNWAFYALTIVGPIVLGLYVVIFNRRYTEGVFRWQNAFWSRLPGNIHYSERWIPLYRVFSVIVGAGMVIIGLAYAAQELARW